MKDGDNLNSLSSLILGKICIGLIVLDQDNTVVIWNRQAEELTGIKNAQVTGAKLTDIYPDFSRKDIEQALSDVEQGFYSAALVRLFIPPANFIAGSSPRLRVLVDSMLVDNKRYSVIQFLEEGPAYHDALTGLPNRILLQDRLELAIAHANRNKHSVALLFLDLDHFKFINDTLGHVAGDMLLQEVAKRIINCLRREDTVSRFGGDEFALLLPEIYQADHVSGVARKILDVLKKPWIYKEQEFRITASIGVAIYPEHGQSNETLMKNSDIAMYRAKNQGRNNFLIYDAAMSVRDSEQLALMHDL